MQRRAVLDRDLGGVAVLRVVIGGAIGLALTYGVGSLFGTAIG